MSDADIISAMRRKAGVGRPPPDVQPMSAEKALRLAVAKAAEDVLGLPLLAQSVEESQTAISRLPEDIPDCALLSLLEGPNTAYGLAVLDKNTVSAIVEQQTAGKVLSLPPETRAPTATDAVMCTAVCDRMLSLFASAVETVPNPPDVAGFRAVAQLREARSIAIAFEDIPYRLYRVRVRLGHVGREGDILFVFPWSRPRAAAQSTDEFSATFQDVVYKSEAVLDTVLHRATLTVGEVMGLEVGTVLSIPREALSRVELRADGRRISRACLGQINGKRALRLVIGDPDEDERSGSMTAASGASHTALSGSPMSGSGPDSLPASVPELDLPSLGGLPDIGELPPLGELPPRGAAPDLDFPAMDGLPPLGDM